MTSLLSIAEREALGQIALEIANEASQIVMQGYRAALDVSEKGRADLVTQYDVASERLIKQRLQERAPEIAVIGEESGGHEREGRAFYVDPIDGTTNFVHGHPFFCVCIGLYEDGQATLGA